MAGKATTNKTGGAKKAEGMSAAPPGKMATTPTAQARGGTKTSKTPARGTGRAAAK